MGFGIELGKSVAKTGANMLTGHIVTGKQIGRAHV